MYERQLLHARDTGGGVPQGGHRGTWQALGHKSGQRARVPIQGLCQLLRGRGHRDKIHTTRKAEPERVYRKVRQAYSEDVLDAHLFRDIEEVNMETERFREEYNSFHPHKSLGRSSPKEFLEVF